LFVRAALKGRHTLARGATPGMNKTNKTSPERASYANPGYNPGVEMNEIKQRPEGAQYKT